MSDLTQMLSDFRVELKKHETDGTPLPLQFAYITDEYNKIIKKQRKQIKRLKLVVKAVNAMASIVQAGSDIEVDED